MTRLMKRLLILAALMLCLVRFAGAETPTGFLNKTIKMGDHTYKYVLYVPADYTPKVKLPVILFLHGSGERGADGLKQSEVGIGRAIRLHPDAVWHEHGCQHRGVDRGSHPFVQRDGESHRPGGGAERPIRGLLLRRSYGAQSAK